MRGKKRNKSMTTASMVLVGVVTFINGVKCNSVLV